MVRTTEDFLARRTRLLFLDIKACIEVAEKVTKIIAYELQKDNVWIEKQLDDFYALSKIYLPQ